MEKIIFLIAVKLGFERLRTRQLARPNNYIEPQP